MKKVFYLTWLLLCAFLAPVVSNAQAFVPELNHVYHFYYAASLGAGATYYYRMGIGGNDTDQYQIGVAAYVQTGSINEANRQWTFEDAGGGRFRIRNRNSLLFLEENAQTSADFTPNASRAVQNTYTGDNRQVWSLEPTTSSPVKYVFRNYSTNHTLTNIEARKDQGSNVSSVIATDSRPDSWNIQDVSVNPNSNYYSSFFKILNNNSGQPLSVAEGSNTDRAVMQVNSQNWARASAEWRFIPASTSGYYYVVNGRNNLVLEIGGGSTNLGATVNLWENYQHAWQEWAFLDINDSHILLPNEFTDGRVVKMYSRHAGKVLEIGGGSFNSGATANIWNDFSHPWQQWRLQFNSFNRVSTTLASATSSGTPTVNLYPNPATQTLELTAIGTFDLSSSTISITDMSGKLVRARYQDGRLDVSGLAAGLYVLTIANSKQTFHQKFSKL